jgi:Protein of unknown function (DUF2806)
MPGNLLIRLSETLIKGGVCRLLHPFLAERLGNVRLGLLYDRKLILAQAKRDADDILTGRRQLAQINGRYTLPVRLVPLEQPSREADLPSEVAGIVELSVARSVSDAIRQELNLAEAITHAEEHLKSAEQGPPNDWVSTDWLYRWRDAAGQVSVKELQEMWGRLLAGEVKAPGSFSLRTLEFVRNLSVRDADEISRLARFAVSTWVYCGQPALLEDEGLTYEFLLRMQELGVLSGVENGMAMTFSGSQLAATGEAFRSNGRAIVVRAGDRSRTLQLSVYKVTQLGQEVMRLGSFAAHEPYLIAICREIKGQGFNVTLARCAQGTSNAVQIFDEQPI